MARAASSARAFHQHHPQHNRRHQSWTPRLHALPRSTTTCVDIWPAPHVITPGIAALGQQAVQRIVKTIEVYDELCHANDPHEEHDFGAFEADGHRVFFKIDYFDSTLSYHSPDPADPKVTKRVITIMLAEEY